MEGRFVTHVTTENGNRVDFNAYNQTKAIRSRSIGKTLLKLGKEWQEEIPPIQGLVVDQKYGLPGDGVHFLRDQKLDLRQKKAIVAKKLRKVFCYPRWLEVLEELGLSPTDPLNTELEQPADHHGNVLPSEIWATL